MVFFLQRKEPLMSPFDIAMSLRKNGSKQDSVVSLALISVYNALWNILSLFQHMYFSRAPISLPAHVKNKDK